MDEIQAQVQSAAAQIQLIITYDQMRGGVSVQGPIDNGFVCHGMLGMAARAIDDHARNAAKPKLTAVAGRLASNSH